jgi:hypothetical protein
MADTNADAGSPSMTWERRMSSMDMNTDASVRRAPARRPVFATFAATFLATVLVLAACEGDNLFSGDTVGGVGGPTGAPRVTSIAAPTSVPEGGTLDVRVKAIAPGGMKDVTVQFRRGVVASQSVARTGTDTVTVDVSVAVPATVQDSVIEVRAFATDAQDRVSEVLTATVRVESRTLPNVTVSVTPSGTASLGDTLAIRVGGSDNFGLQSLGYFVLNAAGDTIQGPAFVAVSGVARDTLFTYVLPSGTQVGQVSVIGLAVNTALLRGVSSPLALTLVDALAPTVQLLQPQDEEPFPLSDSVLVRVHVVDSGGIASISMKGVAIRTDNLQNTVVVNRYAERSVPFPQAPATSFPVDTTIQRYLQPLPDTTSEPVYLIVTARDRNNNVSADTVRIIDGPRITIVDPEPGTSLRVNSTMLVRLNASDRLSGLDSVKLVVSGVRQEVVTLRNLGARQALDTTLALPTGATVGTLTLRPGVWNRRGIGGFSLPVSVTVAEQGVASDTVAPRVLRMVQTNERVELDDSIVVTVRATDGAGSGIQRMGIVVTLTPDIPQLPTRTVFRTTNEFAPPLSGTPERIFRFALDELYAPTQTTLPRKFAVQAHAFAIDEAGNCGASAQTTLTAAECEEITDGGISYFTGLGQVPAQLQVTAVAGESVTLPGGGRIADAVVDAARRRVYLSNIQNNRVDIFHLGPDTFDITGSSTGRGIVGAAPWGLAINVRGDSLIVANSGGTNISILPLDGAGYMREDVQRRVLTPNVVLWELSQAISETGVRYSTKVLDYSDRPQFVAQHQDGFLVYSTLPTTAARDGTIRVADTNPDATRTDDLPESYILLPDNATSDADNTWAIANLDSVKIVRGDVRDLVVLYDHRPGFYRQLDVASAVLPFAEAVADIAAKGSDVTVVAGTWNPAAFALADTTFIAASTTREKIAIGEGARAGTGRVFMCCDISSRTPLRIGISSGVAVTDLVNNAAERVFGVGLNYDGSYGVARGALGTYYFTPDLRLQGEFHGGVAGGAGGSALHPLHDEKLETGDNALSFAATPNRSIKVIDATHFYERGEVQIRDNVVGPLRATLPAPEENTGLSEMDPNYIVVKLVAVTANNNVVVVNVRRKDIGN